MKVCFFKYQDSRTISHCTPEFIDFYQQELIQILENKLGSHFGIFIGCLIRNFPKNHLWYLNPNKKQTQTEVHHIVISCYQILLLFGHSKTINPLTGLFFSNNGQFDIKNVTKSFVMGLEVEYKHSYLMQLLNNFQTLRNPNGDGTYACGNNCDYIYIIQECGNVTESNKCPWCKADIGGFEYNKPVQRSGHIRMNDDKALNILQEKVTLYDQKHQRGYFNITTHSEDPNLTQNGLKPISWRLLRTFLHSQLYFFLTVGGSNEIEFKQKNIINQNVLETLKQEYSVFLMNHITNDMNIIFKLLSSAGNDCQPSWIYSVLTQMPALLTQFDGSSPQTLNIVRQFERAFDNNIVGLNYERIAEISQCFKQQLIQGEQGQSVRFEILLNELELDFIAYPYLQFYRLTRGHSFEDMRLSFKKIAKNEKNYPLLNICLNHYQSMVKLRQFYPVIEFTNYMVNRFSHMITRNDAREKKLRDVINACKDDDLIIFGQQFNRFRKAWSAIGFEGKIQYGCKQNKYIKDYNDQYELIFFLIDNKEQNGGMCLAAGLQELAKIQNKILRDLIILFSKVKKMNENYVIDQFKYPPQRIKENHIINFNIDSDTMLSVCSLNTTKYGQGQELIYDYGRIESNIVKEFINKKLINEEHFQFIQYQLEIMILNGDRSNFVTEIRGKIPQKKIEDKERIHIDQYFEAINYYNDAEKPQQLRVLHGGLEKILCFLQNSVIDKKKGIQTIEEFCAKIDGSKEKQYSDHSVLSQVKLENIIELYQIIEEKYFPYITKNLKQEFIANKNLDNIEEQLRKLLRHCDLKQDGGEAAKEEDLIPSRKDIQIAVMRFMIRYLAGDLNHEVPLKMYINGIKEDLWDEELLINHQYKFDNLDVLMPANIQMESIYCTYMIMAKLNAEQNNKRPMGPELQPQAAVPNRLYVQGIHKPKQEMKSKTQKKKDQANIQ